MEWEKLPQESPYSMHLVQCDFVFQQVLQLGVRSVQCLCWSLPPVFMKHRTVSLASGLNISHSHTAVMVNGGKSEETLVLFQFYTSLHQPSQS